MNIALVLVILFNLGVVFVVGFAIGAAGHLVLLPVLRMAGRVLRRPVELAVLSRLKF